MSIEFLATVIGGTLYRLGIISAGITSIILAYKLFRAGVFETAAQELQLKFGRTKFVAKAAAPGVVLGLFGMAMVIASAVYPPTFDFAETKGSTAPHYVYDSPSATWRLDPMPSFVPPPATSASGLDHSTLQYVRPLSPTKEEVPRGENAVKTHTTWYRGPTRRSDEAGYVSPESRAALLQAKNPLVKRGVEIWRAAKDGPIGWTGVDLVALLVQPNLGNFLRADLDWLRWAPPSLFSARGAFFDRTRLRRAHKVISESGWFDLR